jgi:hypothetical protein
MWVDEKVKRLSQPLPCGFTLFQRFLTGPELSNVPGLFVAWEGGLASALKWPIVAFRKAFDEVSAAGLVEADWDAGLVWVPKAIEHNEPESINVVLSWASTIAELPDCPLKLKAFARFEAWAKAKGKPWEEAWAKAKGKPWEEASDKACPMATEKGDRGASPIQEQDTRSGSNQPDNSLQRPDTLCTEPAAQSKKPKHIANFERSFLAPSRPAVELFDAYRDESGKLGAKLDARAQDLFESLVVEGITAADVREIVRGAKRDDWARDTAKLAASAILGSSEQRERFRSIAREPPKPKVGKGPRQPNGGDFSREFLGTAHGVTS